MVCVRVILQISYQRCGTQHIDVRFVETERAIEI